MAEPTIIDSIRYFGNYQILGEIARGGMGVVYLARQTNLNREVALKLIRAGTLASRRDLEQFRVEAEAAASLGHPNIVGIYETGEHEGQPFVAMQLIEGSSLAELLVDGAWTASAKNGVRHFQRIAEISAKLADAVHHAHQRGVIHRDLKPSNVLIDSKGEPFLTDFGLAKLVEGGAGHTQTGQVLGTPSYMSPGRPSVHTMLFVANRLYELGQESLARVFDEYAHRRDLSGAQLVHLTFGLSANDSAQLFTNDLQNCGNEIEQQAIGLVIQDHAEFIKGVYDRLSNAAQL